MCLCSTSGCVEHKHEGTTVGWCCSKQIKRFKMLLPAPQEESLSSTTTTFSGASDQLSSHQSPCLYLAQKLHNIPLWRCHLGFLTSKFFAEPHFEAACLEKWKDKEIFYFLRRKTGQLSQRRIPSFCVFPFFCHPKRRTIKRINLQNEANGWVDSSIFNGGWQRKHCGLDSQYMFPWNAGYITQM